MALVVKNPPASAGDIRDSGLIPGSEDPLEEGMATHSSVLAWRIPWTEEPAVYRVTKRQTRLKPFSTSSLGGTLQFPKGFPHGWFGAFNQIFSDQNTFQRQDGVVNGAQIASAAESTKRTLNGHLPDGPSPLSLWMLLWRAGREFTLPVWSDEADTSVLVLSASGDDGNLVSPFVTWLGQVALTEKAVDFSRAGWVCPAWGREPSL